MHLMRGVSLLLCTHFIKPRFNVGYCNTHFAFNINLVAIVTTLNYSLCNGPLLHNIRHTGKLRIVTGNYVILSQVNLPGTNFSSQNFEIQNRLDTKHQVREDPRQLSQCLRQSLVAHQGAQFGNRCITRLEVLHNSDNSFDIDCHESSNTRL